MSDTLVRVAVAHLVAFARKASIDRTLDDLYPNDQRVRDALADPGRFVQRAAAAPAATVVVGWAAELVDGRNLGVMASVAPQSIFARLSARGVAVTGERPIRLPTRAMVSPQPSPFVAESQPIPLRAEVYSASLMSPCKAALITDFTLEMARQSTPSIERLVRTSLAENVALGIDAVLLGNSAGSAAQPPGLLNGLTPIVGSADPVADIGKLSAAISPAAQDLVLIMNSDTALRLRLKVVNSTALAVLESDIVADGAIIGIDAADFGSLTGGGAIDVDDSASLVQDAAPLPISTGTSGAGALTAAPVMSLWQQGSIAVRIIEMASWAMRRAGRVALLSGLTW